MAAEEAEGEGRLASQVVRDIEAAAHRQVGAEAGAVGRAEHPGVAVRTDDHALVAAAAGDGQN